MKEEIRIKKQELDFLIKKDNHAWWGRTGDDYSKEIKQCREELDELESK